MSGQEYVTVPVEHIRKLRSDREALLRAAKAEVRGQDMSGVHTNLVRFGMLKDAIDKAGGDE